MAKAAVDEENALGQEDADDPMARDQVQQGRRRSYTVLSPTSGAYVQAIDMIPTLADEELSSDEDDESDRWGDLGVGGDPRSRSRQGFNLELETGSKEKEANREPPNALFHKLCIWHGNPSCLAVDALVRSANPNLVETNRGESYWRDAVERASISKLHMSCETYLARNHSRALESGHVVVTPGFELPCKYILHVVSPPCTESLERLKHYYRCAINKAASENFKTLGLPLIGDEASYSLEETVDAMVEVLLESFPNPLSKLQKIIVVHEDDQELMDIRHRVSMLANG